MINGGYAKHQQYRSFKTYDEAMDAFQWSAAEHGLKLAWDNDPAAPIVYSRYQQHCINEMDRLGH